MKRVDSKILEDFQPFFEEMVNEIIKHYPEKGDTWKTCDELILVKLLHDAVKELDNKMVHIEHLVDISIISGMLYMRRKHLVFHSSEDVN